MIAREDLSIIKESIKTASDWGVEVIKKELVRQLAQWEATQKEVSLVLSEIWLELDLDFSKEWYNE